MRSSPIKRTGNQTRFVPRDASESAASDLELESSHMASDEDEANASDQSDNADNTEADSNNDSNGEEEDEDGEDGEDEEDDIDEEPALRYKRLGGNIHTLFAKDSASTLIASDKFLVLGTHWGNVVIIDFEGNEIKKWRAHSTTVNSVSVDLDNEYVASAGDDGRVVVRGLYNNDLTIVDYSRPVKAVALDPMYSRKASRRFVSGGTSGQLVMYEKRWYGKSDTILFTSSGPIQVIQWQGDLVAWACDEGVQIYDTTRATRISQISRPEGSPRPDLFSCRLQWKDERTLVIGWANFVQVVTLKDRSVLQQQQQQHPQSGQTSSVAADSGSGPSLYAEITVLFRTDFVVCGLALYRDHFLVFSYGDHRTIDIMSPERGGEVPEETRQRRARNAQPPELRMINWNIEEVSSDVLALEGFPLLQPNDYGLAYCAARQQPSAPRSADPASDPAAAGKELSGDADTWFILSPKQLVSVRPRGLQDHVQWLTERGDYRQALGDIEEAYANAGPWAMYRSQIKQDEYRAIGQSYAQTLMDAGNPGEAAEVCARVLPRTDSPESVAAWESWIFAFAEANALELIAPHIPVSGLQLSNTVYEMVLAFLLTSDIAEFRHLVLSWPSTLFNAYSVVLAVEDQLEKTAAEGDRRVLKEIMAFLYDKLNKPSKSLKYHLELFADGILDRVRRENLFDAIRDKAELVMCFDDHSLGIAGDRSAELKDRCEAKGVQLLTDNTDAIPCASVVKQLVAVPEHLHVYLHTLLGKDAHLGAPFADLQVELYAEYNPERLLNFLRVSTYYSFDKALEICEERALVPEMVFILGRMGDNHRALMLIIDRLRDVPRAIEFAKEQNDPELWNDLVMYSRDKPEFIIGLLELGGTHTNPTKVICNIPADLSIPGIRRALTNVLHDYHLQVELCTDCKRVLDGDCEVLSDGLRRLQHQGMAIESEQMCLVCQLPLEDMPSGCRSALAFWCGHIFHDKCILLPEILRKTHLSEASDSSLNLRQRNLRMVHGPREQRRMLMQGKLDRTVLIRQYDPRCPVCAEYDQKKSMQAHSGWSPAERMDRAGLLADADADADEAQADANALALAGERAELPPMLTLLM